MSFETVLNALRKVRQRFRPTDLISAHLENDTLVLRVLRSTVTHIPFLCKFDDPADFELNPDTLLDRYVEAAEAYFAERDARDRMHQ